MTVLKHDWEEFWKFLDDKWYHDDDDVPDYVDNLRSEETFEFSTGFLQWQGKGKQQEIPGLIPVTNECPSLVETFTRWQKSRETVTLIVEVSKKSENKIFAAIKLLGGKVIK